MKLSYAAAFPVILAMTLSTGIQAGAEGGKFGICDAEANSKSRACFHELYVSECADEFDAVSTARETLKGLRKEIRAASDDEAEALEDELDAASAAVRSARDARKACRHEVRDGFGRRADRRSKRQEERLGSAS